MGCVTRIWPCQHCWNWVHEINEIKRLSFGAFLGCSYAFLICRFVGPFIPRKERLKSRDTSKFTNIYVKNFDESMTDEKLKELFSPFGTITSCKVMLNKDGVSKGFGFCAFQDPACADAAVKALHDKPLEEGGKPLYAARAQKRAERDHELQKLYKQKRADRQKNYQGVNLYVKNLDDEFTDDRLRKEFAVFGNITSAKVGWKWNEYCWCSVTGLRNIDIFGWRCSFSPNFWVQGMIYSTVHVLLWISRIVNEDKRTGARLHSQNCSTMANEWIVPWCTCSYSHFIS